MAHICHCARYLFPNPKLPWARQGLRSSFQKNDTCHLKTFQSNSIQNKLPPTAACERPFGCKSLGWALGEVTEDKAFKNDKSQKTGTQLSTLQGRWSLSQCPLASVLITRLNKRQLGTSLCSFVLSLRDQDKLYKGRAIWKILAARTNFDTQRKEKCIPSWVDSMNKSLAMEKWAESKGYIEDPGPQSVVDATIERCFWAKKR